MSKRSKAKASFLSIDKYNLDEEWVAQPDLYHKHSRRMAAARKEAEQAKIDLDLIYARLYKKVKSNPKRYFGDDRPTETAISTRIETMPEHVEAQQRLIDLRYELDIHTATVNALEHRRSSLKHLTELHLAEYFGDKPNKTRSHD